MSKFLNDVINPHRHYSTSEAINLIQHVLDLLEKYVSEHKIIGQRAARLEAAKAAWTDELKLLTEIKNDIH